MKSPFFIKKEFLWS